MSKKLVETPIFVSSVQEANLLIPDYLSSQKVSFICETCHKQSIKTVGSFIKNKLLKCKSCSSKEASALGKLALYGHITKVSKPSKNGCGRGNAESKEVRSKAARESSYKRKQTLIEKYGSLENFYKLRELKIKETCLEKYSETNAAKSPLIRDKIKQTCLEKYNVENPAQAESVILKTRKKYFYDNYHFDSSWELALYIFLRDNNIKFIYHPKIKFKYEFNNKQHFYFPDFIIDNKIYEIKNDSLYRDMLKVNTLENAKLECMKANNVQILFYKDIKKYLDYVSANYGKTFLKECRNETAA